MLWGIVGGLRMHCTFVFYGVGDLFLDMRAHLCRHVCRTSTACNLLMQAVYDLSLQVAFERRVCVLVCFFKRLLCW